MENADFIDVSAGSSLIFSFTLLIIIVSILEYSRTIVTNIVWLKGARMPQPLLQRRQHARLILVHEAGITDDIGRKDTPLGGTGVIDCETSSPLWIDSVEKVRPAY